MLKVYISEPDFNFGGPQLLIVDILPDGTRRAAKTITFEWEPMTPGRSVSGPTIDFGNWDRNEEFVQAMADAIVNRKTPTKNDHTIGGKLEATERHLEDLQKLLKLKPGLVP